MAGDTRTPTSPNCVCTYSRPPPITLWIAPFCSSLLPGSNVERGQPILLNVTSQHACSALGPGPSKTLPPSNESGSEDYGAWERGGEAYESK
jgi:hypothetical protein